MELNGLPRTAATFEKSAETIKKLCAQYGIEPKTITNASYKDMPWDMKYPKYLRLITGFDPCPVCFGPQRVKDEISLKEIRVFKLFSPSRYCFNHPFHTVAITTCLREIRRQVQKGLLSVPGVDYVYPHGNWHWIETLKDLPDTPVFHFLVMRNLATQLGDICKHNYFFADCRVCITELKERYEEQIGIRVVVELAKDHVAN